MKIRMLQQISGSRCDGSPWPAPGEELDVDAAEGMALTALANQIAARTDLPIAHADYLDRE